MPNDSSTGGYLLPVGGTAPLEDSALDDLFQQLVVGVTGLPAPMVRPRWQPVVPKQPDPSVDWCGIGVTVCDPLDFPVLQHDGASNDGNGSDNFAQHEALTVLASFYGPDAGSFAKLLRNGLYVPQNRDTLTAQGMSLISVGKATTAPELVNQQWIRRIDVSIDFRRKVARVYPVLNILLSGGVNVSTDLPT